MTAVGTALKEHLDLNYKLKENQGTRYNPNERRFLRYFYHSLRKENSIFFHFLSVLTIRLNNVKQNLKKRFEQRNNIKEDV